MDSGTLHHLELWVDDLDRTELSFGWRFPRLGFTDGARSATSTSFQGPGHDVFFEVELVAAT